MCVSFDRACYDLLLDVFRRGADAVYGTCLQDEGWEGNGADEVDLIQVQCPACSENEHERIYPTSIPHFGNVRITSPCVLAFARESSMTELI